MSWITDKVYDMEIEEIYPPFIYSIRYDGQGQNEFHRLFTEWNDVEAIMTFLEENEDYLKVDIWKSIKRPEQAAVQVLNEAMELEIIFDTLAENAGQGYKPDFDSHFKYLDGQYKYVLSYIPMKSYGMEKPSLLRIYAIKLESNVYLITGGGIKLADTIQRSPGLKEHVLQNIDRVITWLKQQGIAEGSDI